METKSVRDGNRFAVRIAQALIAYILFRVTVPFAGNAVYGTLSALGLDIFVTGPLTVLSLLPVLVISFGVPVCIFVGWYYWRT